MLHIISESKSLLGEVLIITNDSQLLGEIMPMIYKRFTEKAAEEWRQIYKVFSTSSAKFSWGKKGKHSPPPGSSTARISN